MLGAEAESAEDGKGAAVDDGNAASLRAVEVGARRVADVLLEPHAAECLLQTVVAASSSHLASPFLLALAEWADEVELALHLDNLVPVVVQSLEPVDDLFVDVQSLSEHLSVEAGKEVFAVAPLLLLSTPALLAPFLLSTLALLLLLAALLLLLAALLIPLALLLAELVLWVAS